MDLKIPTVKPDSIKIKIEEKLPKRYKRYKHEDWENLNLLPLSKLREMATFYNLKIKDIEEGNKLGLMERLAEHMNIVIPKED